jgi:hypothetical protein
MYNTLIVKKLRFVMKRRLDFGRKTRFGRIWTPYNMHYGQCVQYIYASNKLKAKMTGYIYIWLKQSVNVSDHHSPSFRTVHPTTCTFIKV